MPIALASLGHSFQPVAVWSWPISIFWAGAGRPAAYGGGRTTGKVKAAPNRPVGLGTLDALSMGLYYLESA
ncbi:MAG TPA: hypothetical protein VNO32_61205 [Candidatus Acidoferrum sp.]|nr:hypothetical protein [Candidatus Acidoferrum sp.]